MNITLNLTYHERKTLYQVLLQKIYGANGLRRSQTPSRVLGLIKDLKTIENSFVKAKRASELKKYNVELCDFYATILHTELQGVLINQYEQSLLCKLDQALLNTDHITFSFS